MFHKGLNEPEAGWPLVRFERILFAATEISPILAWRLRRDQKLKSLFFMYHIFRGKKVAWLMRYQFRCSQKQNCCFTTLFMVHSVMCVSNSHTPEPSETLAFELGAFNSLNMLFIRRTLHLFSSEAALIVALFQQRALLPLPSVCLR